MQYSKTGSKRGGVVLQPLKVLEYPWEIIGIYYVVIFPKSGIYGSTNVFIMVCHFTQMAHFVPYHKEITAEESIDFSITNRYRLHGVPKVMVSDKDPKFVGNFGKAFGKIKHKVKYEYWSTSSYSRFNVESQSNYASTATMLLCII